jgi:hypothetical protein
VYTIENVLLFTEEFDFSTLVYVTKTIKSEIFPMNTILLEFVDGYYVTSDTSKKMVINTAKNRNFDFRMTKDPTATIILDNAEMESQITE